jgi:hypothetical protein
MLRRVMRSPARIYEHFALGMGNGIHCVKAYYSTYMSKYTATTVTKLYE